MGAYILRRILISIPVLLGITIIGFVALRAAPGDPLLVTANPEVLARLLANPQILEAERHRLGFDQPIFPNQYLQLAGRRPAGQPGELGHDQADRDLRGRLAHPADAVAHDGRSQHGRRHRHPDRRPDGREAVFEARLRPERARHLPRVHAGLRARAALHLHLRRQSALPADERPAHVREERLTGHALPPDPARDGAGDRQRGAAGAVHAREHARRAEQRLHHDGHIEGPRAPARSSCGTRFATG